MRTSTQLVVHGALHYRQKKIGLANKKQAGAEINVEFPLALMLGNGTLL